MLPILRSSWPLFLGIALLMIGNSMQGTLLGLRGKIEGFDAETMGFVMASYFIGFLGGSWFTPGLIRKVGHVRVFAALGSLISAALIVYAVFLDPILWGAMRFLIGFGFSGVYVVAESWVNNAASNENRGQALSAYIIVQMGGIVAGQALIPIGDPGSFELFILMSVLVSLSFAPILLSAAPAPAYDRSVPMGLGELYRSSPLGCVGNFVLGAIFGALFGMGAVYATERGLTVGQTSTFISAIYLGGLILQFPIGWLSDRTDRRRLIAATTVVATLACGAAILLAEASFPALLGCAFVLGGMANPLYGLLIAHTNDFLAPEKMAGASSGLVFLNGLGATLGPVTSGYALEVLGPDGFFWFIGAACAAISGYAFYRMTQRAAASPDDTVSYQPTVSRTPMMAETVAEIHADDPNADAFEPEAPEAAEPADARP